MENKWIVYRTINNVNNNIYVGVHKLANTSKSKSYLGSGYALGLAIQKYGKENFTRTTLAEFSCAEEAYLAEAEIVDLEFVNRSDTYNIKLGGVGGIDPSTETKAKLSAASKGNKHWLGKTHTAETKIKLSAAQLGNKKFLGKTHPVEARAKMSAALKGRNLGKPLTPETKAKMSLAAKGKVFSEEHKINISNSKKGNKHKLGIPHTEEAKQKIRASKIGGKNPQSKAVLINNKYYESASLAAEEEGVSSYVILYRIRNTNPKYDGYSFAPPEGQAEQYPPQDGAPQA